MLPGGVLRRRVVHLPSFTWPTVAPLQGLKPDQAHFQPGTIGSGQYPFDG
jgi:hypothetical protein